MSIVSSYFSTRTPAFRINVQASSLMDHLLAIVAGLGVRIVIDIVSHQDNRLTGTLVGLWEGVVLQHFIKKAPKSYDPYVAYGVRVFLDFLLRESLTRLILTVIWTGMGVIFADIAPAVYKDSGLRRFWRHLRRDLYILVHSVPEIPYFARPRTVRFSPSQAPSVITSAPPSPSVVTVTTVQAPPAPIIRKRPVPGTFPDYISETDAASTIRSPASDYSALADNTRNRRPTVHTESELSYDPDEGNLSSSGSGTPTPALSEANLPNIEDVEDMEREVVLEEQKDENTPRPVPIHLPPTPGDSALALRPVVNPEEEEPLEVPPPTARMPQIPDDDDWENISRREALPTPPPKDRVPATSPAEQPAAPEATTAQVDLLDLDPLAEQPHVPAPAATAVEKEPKEEVDDWMNDKDAFLDNEAPENANNAERLPAYSTFDFGTVDFNQMTDSNLWDAAAGFNNKYAGATTNMDFDVDGIWEQEEKQEDQQQADSAPQEETTQPEDATGEKEPSGETGAQDQATTADPDGTTIDQAAVTTEPSSDQPPADKGKGKVVETSNESKQAVDLNALPEDNEPLPDNAERLQRSLSLRKEIIQLDKNLQVQRRSRTRDDPSADARIEENEKKLNMLEKRAERWYNMAARLYLP
ncbi:hypothetical protein H0H92_002362 [Tricholoma furcatifolium]|nr:hypothetical protein H0H92_002362 [Tricholoma furcatifolium]